MPAPGYLKGVRDLCTKYGALYIADEVQTGFMRCGQMWGWQEFGVQPDLFIAAKGLSGGLYPIAVCMLGERAGGWLHEDGAAHISTTGGGEVGCLVALRVLEILQRPETRANTRAISEFFAEGFADLIRRHPDVLVGLRQKGTVMGVEFDHPEGAVAASRALYESGVWAIFSSLDKRVLQFKPGVLMSRALCEEVIERFDTAIPRIRELIGEMKKG
jgi:acetylornithine/succinyldiaminopimelate/putrescine aminotransferase